MTDQPTPERILTIGQAYQQTQVLVSAVEIGVFGALADGPLDLEALSARLGLHPRGARDFLDTLVALGLLEREDGRYANAPDAAAYLVPGRPTYLGSGVSIGALPGAAALTAALRTGEPTTPRDVNENRYRTVYYQDEARARVTTAAFTARALLWAPVLAGRFPWRDYRTVADVGTARGALPVQLALAHPHLRAIGFDLPQLRPIFEEYVASFGVADRVRFQPGDFDADPLPSADVLVLSAVLHNWDHDRQMMLLRKAHAALPPGGVLIVREELIDDDRRGSVPALLGSLGMLANTAGGRNFTGAECQAWLRQTGFRDTRVEPLVATHSIAIGVR